MSDSSSVQLFYNEESVWGTTPSAPMKEFRFTSESLNQATETAVSEEIRDDRQVADIIRTQVSANGEAGIELSYGAHDDLLEGALFSDWTTDLNSTGSLTFAVGSPTSTTSITCAASPGIFTSARIVAGMWVQISGSAVSPTRNGFFKVAQRLDNDTIEVVGTIPAGSESVRIRGGFLRNGVTRKSYSLEKLFSDLSPVQYVGFKGMRVGSLSLNIAPGSILNGGFSFEGKQAFAAGVTIGNGSITDAPTNDVLNAVDNITDIKIDGASPGTGVFFTEVSLEVQNNLRAQPAIGSLANIGIGAGRCMVSGSIQSYFQNRTLLDKYLAFTTTALSFRAVDGLGNSYLFDFPAVKFSTGANDTPGNDEDVVVNLEFMCKRDPVYDFMFGISRFAA